MSTATDLSVAQYVRMSTDAQELSPAIQMQAIKQYAGEHGFTIVETYLDAGRSGLTLHKRPAMKKLLQDVTSEQCPYSLVLVYDISRWGRFQDTDASAYYEYHCRLHGVDVRYVKEPFDGANTPLASVIKSLKRAMAAEYSRELAVKTRAGQNAALDSGFHLGTLPCIGISRQAVSKQSGAERMLRSEEHKAVHREHVRWVRGPAHEVELVRRIFRIYATTDISVSDLANRLQLENCRTQGGKPITQWMLYSLLKCEALVGNFVWGRDKGSRRRSDNDVRFRRVENCIEPIVSQEIWAAVQAKRLRRACPKRSQAELLEDLRAALAKNSRLTGAQLKQYGCACATTYVKFFGSVANAFRLVGFEPRKPDKADYEQVQKARERGWELCNAATAVLRGQGVECERIRKMERGGQSILINGQVRVRLQTIWRKPKYGELVQWSLPKIYGEPFDYVLVVRRNADDTVFDSILFRRDQYFRQALWFTDALPGSYEVYDNERVVASRFRTLSPWATPVLTDKRDYRRRRVPSASVLA